MRRSAPPHLNRPSWPKRGRTSSGRTTMMRRVGLAAIALAGLCTFGFPAHSAILTTAGGPVRVDDGSGYRPVATFTEVKPGNRILVGKNASAMLHYSNGCTMTIVSGQHITVERKPTCLAASKRPWRGRSGVQNPGGAPDPTFVFVGGAAISAGLIVAVTRRRNNGASP